MWISLGIWNRASWRWTRKCDFKRHFQETSKKSVQKRLAKRSRWSLKTRCESWLKKGVKSKLWTSAKWEQRRSFIRIRWVAVLASSISASLFVQWPLCRALQYNFCSFLREMRIFLEICIWTVRTSTSCHVLLTQRFWFAFFSLRSMSYSFLRRRWIGASIAWKR